MGQVVQFRIKSLPPPSPHSAKPCLDSIGPPQYSITCQRDWRSLADKLQKLVLLAPKTVRGLEIIVDKMLEQLDRECP